MPEQDSFRGLIQDYDTKFPRGSCRRDSPLDRVEHAKTLPDGVLGLRKAPQIRFTPDSTTTSTTTSPTNRPSRSRRAPQRYNYITNAGEHHLLRHLREADPEIYELKLLEWDYVTTRDDFDENFTPDLDDPEASEVFFTVGGQIDEPPTATTSATTLELRGGAHHQPCSHIGDQL